MNLIYKLFAACMIAALLTLSLLYVGIFAKATAPKYPFEIEIREGESLKQISKELQEKKVIKHSFVFENFVKVLGKDTQIKTGEYTFKKPMNVIELTDKLVNARYEYTPIRFVIYEGEDARTITDKMHGAFKNIASAYTREELFSILQAKEGYVFPETYTFAPSATLDQVMYKIDNEFATRTAKYNLSPDGLKKVLIIASILEKEVRKPEDMKAVAAIIYNRLKINMPLQMDSTLGYVTNKGSLQLTLSDLKSSSPYNTYKIKGLPPAPIGNPGDSSIDAAINPSPDDYLFFLSDSAGNNYYTKSYAEHLKNRKTYLGK